MLIETHKLADTLRNYAGLEDTYTVFRAVLLEAADRLERLEKERDNLDQEVRNLQTTISSKLSY